MTELKEYKLGEIGTVITGKTPSARNPEDWGDNMLFITPSDYRNYRKYATNSERKLSKVGIDRFEKKILPANSILVTCIGSDMGKVVMNWESCITNQQINAIVPNTSVNNNFLYYRLISIYDTLRILGGDGTAVPIVNKSDFENIKIELPPLPEQIRIASILSSLDDKIDLLHRENKTLEAMAETLFRQWFIEEAKEDWKEVLITDLFEVKDGTHDSPKPQNFGYKLITSKYIHNNSIDFENAYSISENDYITINKRSKVETNDILFSMIGTIGLIYLEENTQINYAIKNIGLIKTSQNDVWKYFVYLWFKSEIGKDWIFENKTGSTQEYISLTSLRNIKFRIKSIEQINQFNQLIEYYFKKIKINKQQIQTLIQQRDSLLPKLMSGEVKI